MRNTVADNIHKKCLEIYRAEKIVDSFSNLYFLYDIIDLIYKTTKYKEKNVIPFEDLLDMKKSMVDKLNFQNVFSLISIDIRIVEEIYKDCKEGIL